MANSEQPEPKFSPPASIEAEEAVLGSMLIDPDAIINVAPILLAEDFYREKNGWIYQAMVDMSGERKPANFVTLIDELERRGRLQQIGGASYVTSLIGAVPTAVHAEHYANIVSAKAAKRKIIALCQRIAGRAYDDAEEADAILDGMASEIFAISERRVEGTLVSTREAMPAVIDRIGYLAEHPDEITGLRTGIEGLDRALGGLQAGDMLVLAARPGQGKTTLALNAAVGAAKRGARVAVFSMEMPVSQLLQRCLAAETGVELGSIKTGKVDEDEWQLLLEGANALSGLPLFIDDTPNASITQIRAKARRLQAELGGLDLVVVDYMQLMSLPGTRWGNRQEEISAISRQMKGLARELSCPVFVLSQMNRSVEQRAGKVPQLSDLRESGAIEQDADIVMFIMRDEAAKEDGADEAPDKAGLAKLIIAKFRNGETGDLPLFFDGPHTRFCDIAFERTPL